LGLNNCVLLGSPLVINPQTVNTEVLVHAKSIDPHLAKGDSTTLDAQKVEMPTRLHVSNLLESFFFFGVNRVFGCYGEVRL
jgi:hypothetical protein